MLLRVRWIRCPAAVAGPAEPPLLAALGVGCLRPPPSSTPRRAATREIEAKCVRPGDDGATAGPEYQCRPGPEGRIEVISDDKHWRTLHHCAGQTTAEEQLKNSNLKGQWHCLFPKGYRHLNRVHILVFTGCARLKPIILLRVSSKWPITTRLLTQKGLGIHVPWNKLAGQMLNMPARCFSDMLISTLVCSKLDPLTLVNSQAGRLSSPRYTRMLMSNSSESSTHFDLANGVIDVFKEFLFRSVPNGQLKFGTLCICCLHWGQQAALWFTAERASRSTIFWSAGW